MVLFKFVPNALDEIMNQQKREEMKVHVWFRKIEQLYFLTIEIDYRIEYVGSNPVEKDTIYEFLNDFDLILRPSIDKELKRVKNALIKRLKDTENNYKVVYDSNGKENLISVVISDYI
jgi:hypothetical protein